RVGQVDVGEADGAGGVERVRQRRCGRRILDNRPARVGGGDGDGVFGAGDGDGDVLGGRRAVSVVDGHGVVLDHALALGEVLRGGIVQRVVPLHGAVGGVCGFADRSEREGAERGGIAFPYTTLFRSRVGQVDVGE